MRRKVQKVVRLCMSQHGAKLIGSGWNIFEAAFRMQATFVEMENNLPIE